MLELPTKLLSLGTGQEATYNTLEHMARLISNGAKSYEVRSVAVELVKHLPAKDQWAEVRSIFNFVKTYMRYTKDPHGVEMLHTPQAILKLIKEDSPAPGDCDDLSILFASLVKSIGYPVRLKVISTHPTGRFTHVYPQVKVYDKWVSADLAALDRPLGWQPTSISRQMIKEV